MGGKVKPGNMVTSFVIPRSVHAWIEHEAHAQGTALSTIIRRAIDVYRQMPDQVRTSLPDPVKDRTTPEGGEHERPPPSVPRSR